MAQNSKILEKLFSLRQITRKWATFANTLSISLLNHLSLFTYHFSLPKHICFTMRKLSFHPPKDRLSHTESLSFATRNIYVWEWKGSEGGVKGKWKGWKMHVFCAKTTKNRDRNRLGFFTIDNSRQAVWHENCFASGHHPLRCKRLHSIKFIINTLSTLSLLYNDNV